jgi:hypothetical protein
MQFGFQNLAKHGARKSHLALSSSGNRDDLNRFSSFRLSDRLQNVTSPPTNHEIVMESGEIPELSRSGIQLQIPIKPIVSRGGEGGEEVRSWEPEYLAFRRLVAPMLDFPADEVHGPPRKGIGEGRLPTICRWSSLRD